MRTVKPWKDDSPTPVEREQMRATLGVFGAGLTDAALDEVIVMRETDASVWVTVRCVATNAIVEAHGQRWVLLHRTGPNADDTADVFIAVSTTTPSLPAPCFAVVVPRA